MFSKILIANRGEIAVRIMRACRELNVEPVIVYSEADKESLPVRYANESYYIGPASPKQSYLNIQRIMEVAEESKSEAIHPGYGFLSQIPAFAKACESQGITFIGPSSHSLEKMGDKMMARKTVAERGVPVIPGSVDPVSDRKTAIELARELGYPILAKAVYGGGGKGMRVAYDKKDVSRAIELASMEAESSFGKSDIYLEKLLVNPRHIEFQILADNEGNMIHLGERECSIQRRFQKLMEETPSPMMTERLRDSMGKAALATAEAANYTNTGTVEFLFDEEKNFYFLEMNTRLQVEHLITELVTDVDIVKEQIRIAAGERLRYNQKDIRIQGHALNCRINSEDPRREFLPCPGRVTEFLPPGGLGVRVDSALYTGYDIPIFYDSLIAKLAVWGIDRDETIIRMKNALNEFIIEGIETTISFHKQILDDEYFLKGIINTGFIDERMNKLPVEEQINYEEIAALSTALAVFQEEGKYSAAVIPKKRVTARSSWKRAGIEDLMRSRMLRSNSNVKRI
jgi:acetyl-CoA carboxylase biotin carboxylase subunit